MTVDNGIWDSSSLHEVASAWPSASLMHRTIKTPWSRACCYMSLRLLEGSVYGNGIAQFTLRQTLFPEACRGLSGRVESFALKGLT